MKSGLKNRVKNKHPFDFPPPIGTTIISDTKNNHSPRPAHFCAVKKQICCSFFHPILPFFPENGKNSSIFQIVLPFLVIVLRKKHERFSKNCIFKLSKLSGFFVVLWIQIPLFFVSVCELCKKRCICN